MTVAEVQTLRFQLDNQIMKATKHETSEQFWNTNEGHWSPRWFCGKSWNALHFSFFTATVVEWLYKNPSVHYYLFSGFSCLLWAFFCACFALLCFVLRLRNKALVFKTAKKNWKHEETNHKHWETTRQIAVSGMQSGNPGRNPWAGTIY